MAPSARTTGPPETRYAENDGVHIAYQVFGEGELELMICFGYMTHVELMWEHEPAVHWLNALGSFARVVMYDRRGSGLSDPVAEPPTLEQRMDDARAVMDAAGFERPALLGISEGVAMCLLLAATHPERVRAIVAYGGMARSTRSDDHPWLHTEDELIESTRELVAPYWGQGASAELGIPSRANDPEVRAFWAKLERTSASPGMIAGLVKMFLDIDVRDVVPEVHVPTLVLHRRHDMLVNVRSGRWLAEHLPDARLIELPGIDHNPWYQAPEVMLGEIEEFLTGTRNAPEPERTLATVLFTDIVDSTATAAELGDQRWRDLLERHQRTVRQALKRAGGREIKSTGDGFLATFDGPARAVRCARAIVIACADDGVRIRAGVHTGEIEVMGDDIGGIGVHIAARVSARAGADEVLVSRTVKDLVAGSGIAFDPRGAHELKGVPDTWELYAATSG